MGPGRGRPPIGRQIMVRIPAELLAEIDRRADEYGLTRAETMRRALADSFPIIPKA
jgi:metal-responsive CopG/Arc/MetJ family transcriptional regulator